MDTYPHIVEEGLSGGGTLCLGSVGVIDLEANADLVVEDEGPYETEDQL